METSTAQRLLFLVFTMSGVALRAEGYSTEVDALLAIRDTLDGPDDTFESWDPDTNPCNGTWFGVACLGGHVTSLNLNNQTLNGQISPSIAALTELQVLQLTYNRLGGWLPDVFGNMTNLQFLDISRNRFVGQIPAGLGNATNVTTLLLANNNFNGSVPVSFANLRQLQVLNLSANDLHGGIMPALVQLPAVQTIDISINSFSGPLPVVPLSPTLESFNVSNNRLLGNIPFAYLSSNLTFRFSGNENLRLPIPPAPGPAPAPAPNSAPSIATSATSNATSPAPAPKPPAVSTPMVLPASVNTTAPPQPGATIATNGSTTSGSGSSNLGAPGAQAAAVGGSIAKDSGGANTGVIVGVSVALAVAACLVVAALLAFLAARKRRRDGPAAYSPAILKDTWQSLPDPQPVSRPYGEARVYPLAMLIRGTHGFAGSQQVGSSPGNKVYVATLPDGEPALIKRRDPAIVGFQSKSEFEKEVAGLGRLSHRNLIPLAGCCDDDKERILIFSAPSATPLRDHLCSGGVQSPGKSPPRPLDLATRVEIASGIAAALAYLHSKSSPRLYERVSSSSVLLDGNFTPRVADFHLERIEDSAGSSPSAENPPRSSEGRRGQSWPARGGVKSVQADVYDLGLILLELVAGRPLFDARAPVEQQNLLAWVIPFLNARDFDSFADPHLAGGLAGAGAALAALCDLARDCIADQDVRPSLAEIQRRLAQCAHLQTSRAASFRPSPRMYSSRDSRWEEEDEYEVRDVPESGPVGKGLGPPLWGPGFVASSAPIEAGSPEPYHSAH